MLTVYIYRLIQVTQLVIANHTHLTKCHVIRSAPPLVGPPGPVAHWRHCSAQDAAIRFAGCWSVKNRPPWPVFSFPGPPKPQQSRQDDAQRLVFEQKLNACRQRVPCIQLPAAPDCPPPQWVCGAYTGSQWVFLAHTGKDSTPLWGCIVHTRAAAPGREVARACNKRRGGA